MAYLTGPALLATKNAGGTIVVGSNTAIRFVGATVASDGPAQTVVTVGAASVTASNLGAGTGVFASIVGSDLQFKSLVAGSGISISSTATEITINGGADTASNLGTGAGVFSAKVGSDFQFKSLVAGSGIGISATASEITISNTSVTGTWLLTGNALSGGEVFGSTNNVDVVAYRNTLEFLRLQATGIVFNGTSNYSFDFNFGVGSYTYGQESTGGTLNASGVGSEASGTAQNTGTLVATSIGSKAFGHANNNGTIQSSGNGSLGFGLANFNSTISSQGSGSYAAGHTIAGGSIAATQSGGFVHGYSTTSANMLASGLAGFTLGYASSFGMINSGSHSLLGGSSTNAIHTNSGSGTIIWGDSISCSGSNSQGFGTDHTISASNAQVLGENNVSSSYASVICGRFGASVGSTGSWISTEPLFVAGNGTSAVARNNAYTLYKDGRQETTASHVNRSIKKATTSYVVNARTDYKILLEDTVAVSSSITLPAGEQGLEFRLMVTAANTATWTILTSGGDVLDGLVPAPNASAYPITLSYLSGVWYMI